MMNFMKFNENGDPLKIQHLFWHNEIDQEIACSSDYDVKSGIKYWKVSLNIVNLS